MHSLGKFVPRELLIYSKWYILENMFLKVCSINLILENLFGNSFRINNSELTIKI